MSAWDSNLRLNTPKLQVPTDFIPTRPHDRGWLVPFFGKNPVWTIPLAIVPAIIATILIFMDQQITAVIINRKEFKLKVKMKYIVGIIVNGSMCIFCLFVCLFFRSRKNLAIISIYSFYRYRFLYNLFWACHGSLLPLFLH
jgi:hypothetical protein